ncbi:MAG: DUF5668 domain-containing protein [Chloroflexota bacterium]|nr:DUF5668 domain-containing protein [Chloroflexota bacterium]
MSSGAAYGPPAAPPQRRRRGGVVGPLILIFIGCVFLLQNTGYLPSNAWQNLWRLWPVILVLAGLEVLLAYRVSWLVLAALAALILVAGAIATSLSWGPKATPGAVTRSRSTDLGGATQATVTIRFGAGDLNIGPLVQPSQNQLAEMGYQGPADLAPEPRYLATPGGVGRLEYQTADSSRGGSGLPSFVGGRETDTLHLDVNLTPAVPIASLQVQTGATNAHLDLSNLNVNSTDIALGAASAWIRLPEAAGKTTAHISSGAATITVEIPQAVAAQVRHHGGLSTLDIDEARFPLVGEGVYRSADYASAKNQVDLSIDTGLTTIVVR